MSTPSTPSRRRTFDFPKSSPDAGLAEWTSRIKAIQQEVDRDEEVEQRRLQDEITHSRMERARRRKTATGSIDWGKKAIPPSSDAPDEVKSIIDREQHQSDALRKLVGPMGPSPSPSKAPPDSLSPTVPNGSKAENISLAAFMGGHATGPRLNKPAPQQDSHDPTLFDQTRRDGPHPIFGRTSEAVKTGERFGSLGIPRYSVVEIEGHEGKGGRVDFSARGLGSVAASGQEDMFRIVKTPCEASSKPAIYPESLNQTVSSPYVTPEARPSTPPEVPEKPVIYRKPLKHAIHTPELTSDPGPSSKARTPPKLPVKPSLLHKMSQGTVPSSELLNSQLHTVPVQPKTNALPTMIGEEAMVPLINNQSSRENVGALGDASTLSRHELGMQGRAFPGMGGALSPTPKKTSSSSTTPTSFNFNLSRPLSQQSPSSDETRSLSSSPKRSFSGPKVVTPSLARPVQPQVVVQPSPIAAASITVSPAFLRAPPSTQDLHPSLSRLQGRGFVEKQVKASAEIYGGSNIQQRERSTSAGADGRRATVLDRWQPNVVPPASPSSGSPPPVQPTNKDEVTEETRVISHLPLVRQVVRPRINSTPFTNDSPPKFDEAKRAMNAVRLPGMASPHSLSSKQQAQPAGKGTDDQRAVVENGVSEYRVGKTISSPLSHPTRDRARKPRKSQESSHTVLRETSRRSERQDADPALEVGRTSEGEVVGDSSRAGRPNGTDYEPPGHVPSPKTKPSTSAEWNMSRLKDDLTYETSMRSVAVVPSSDSKLSNGSASSVLASDRQAIPGMVVSSPTLSGALCPVTPPSTMSSPEELPISPSRHPRIPSTGQRATVMDVAQALQDHELHIRETSLTPEPDDLETTETMAPSGTDAEPEGTPRIDVKAAIAGWGRNIGSGIQQVERRRSAYDRYSIITLPPLAEEKTPIPTPQGSLSRVFSLGEESMSNLHDIPQSLQDGASPNDILQSLQDGASPNDIRQSLQEGASANDIHQSFTDGASPRNIRQNRASPTHTVEEGTTNVPAESVEEKSVEIATVVPAETVEPLTVVDMNVEQEIQLEHHDKPPPGFNLLSLLKETPYSPDPRTQTISVEVLSISGHIATAVTREPNVLYDCEVIAVIHRAKEKEGGLVFTKVWAWRGKDAEFEGREKRKVAELAGRFGSKETHCVQGSEPHELIHILGGVLAIRQGKRVHWTAENTAMHRVHRIGDSIFVDQIDLAIHNLCSAYSYCLSVLDVLYVWHGRGSSEDERKVASAYAQSLATNAMNIIEFEEGTEDEMFWMMLGDEGFANASHWKFKSQLDRSGARLYTIDSTRHKTPVQLIPIFSGRDLPGDGVFVVDCRLELFVVVTPTARGKRIDIQLALFLAENISAAVAIKQPFDPPVHVIILPSMLPLELQATIRLCDEARLNGGSVPDHMNLLPLSEALEHMKRRSWPISTLSDVNFLPLGVDPHMLR